MASESTLSTFTASDGDNLAVQDWPLDTGVPLRGVVLIVHGLGEHAGRYDHVAQQLNAWGFAVRGYDQCGHGESSGLPGSLPTDTRLLDDLADIIDSTRARMEPGTPLILLGHSMGGLVTGRFVSLGMRKVDALIMSSPALNPGMNAFQKLLVAVLPKIAPNLRVGNGLNPSFISHDPAVVQAYTSDPLVHDRISARLARFFATEGPATVALAAQWKVPTLLMYAGADRLVNPQGSRDFAAAAPKDLVTTVCFDALYHEIFNESDATPVFAAMQRWLDQRF
ncbi:MAG: alpha/beta hydrolase [Curvibacter sp.]|nr:MAG: alpha/beta hydrolase [Curvibacter sp.]